MKNPIATSFLIIILSSPVLAMTNSLAASPGTQMSSTHSSQMMTREMMRNMSKIMDQMNIMTRDMKRIMDKTGDMDQLRVRDMARVMEQLSQAMQTMSQQMAKGEMNKNMLQEMEQHMNQIRNMIKTVEQKK